MKKIILASVSSLALLGLAACSDTDTTTTQSTEPEIQETAPTVAPGTGTGTGVTVVPQTDADETSPADGTTTQSITPDSAPMDGSDATGAVPGVIDDAEPTEQRPAAQ